MWHRAVIIFVVAGGAIAFLIWQCTRAPGINFLPYDRQAEWIVFPSASDARMHPIENLDAVFRREFALDSQPRQAQLSVRASKRVQLKINGVDVDLAGRGNWKLISTADVGTLLGTGANVIEAKVANDNSPPALWLSLTTDKLELRSDAAWDASFAGSAWRRVALARAVRLPGPGNLLSGGETTLGSIRAIWPLWLAFAAIALIAWSFWKPSHRSMSILFLVIGILWLILFWNNAVRLPFAVGFDSQAHLDYIKYVQDRHALPLPGDGLEMHQPPLYYFVSAVALSMWRLSVDERSAIVILRSLTMLFCIAHLVFVFLTSRLLFANRSQWLWVGLIVAAFSPMQIYMSHYVTNETLAAAGIAAVIYCSVRLLRTDHASLANYISLGACIGVTMLTKATAILLLPPIIVAVAMKLVEQRSSLATWLRNFGTMLIVGLAICGWHYVRVGLHSGAPFLGMAGTFAWWQDPGYHTAGDYFRFGRSLLRPLFSGFAGFADGIYSTLWGDGLCGGSSDLSYRPPWNYGLMAGGYLLALAPSLLIASGAIMSLFQFVRKPSADSLVVIGFAGVMIFAIIFMSIGVASYAQIKAFFGLSILTPLAVFSVIGWDWLTSRSRLLRFAVGTLLIVWAINSYASFWVRPSATHAYAALQFKGGHKIDMAISEAQRAVNSNPFNASARRLLASVFADSGRTDEAIREAKRAIELQPNDPAGHVQLGVIWMKQDYPMGATEEAATAIALGRENQTAHLLLITGFLNSGRNADALSAARNALAVSPFNVDFHYALGLAAQRTGDDATATAQFEYAKLLRR
jgi:Flp pilus assembly protein TadD